MTLPGSSHHLPIILVSLLLSHAFPCCTTKTSTPSADLPQEKGFELRRTAMVRDQIEDRGITDTAVLGAMRRVPRHLFVPLELRDLSYTDQPLPIGLDQTISQPYIVALMTELLELRKDQKVLEIGTGSGYQAAVLAEIADSVWTIEILEPLAATAEQRLRSLGYRTVHVRSGDGYAGWPECAPFDRIIVTAAAEDIPGPLLEQLKEGGKMVIPVGAAFSIQSLVLVEKREGRIVKKNVTAVRFVPLIREQNR
jgi:protein-L-isoaspartate(D-aspartate) O-methyltransferase